MTTADTIPNSAINPRTTQFFGYPAAIVGVGVMLALMLAVPGQTATTKYVNDLFVFLDGAHRILNGQVPNVDFHSSLGPLSFYLPALGHLISGGMAGAMPVGMAVAVFALALVASWVIGSRMRPVLGLPLAAFLLLAAAVPVNTGEGISELSFAMFYNRLGWAALGLLLVFYLPRRSIHPAGATLDVLSAAVLVLFMLYLKASYGAVGLAFLVFLLTDRLQWRWAAAALAVCVGFGLATELIWGGTSTYIADLQLAAKVSGDLPDFRRLADVILVNLADTVVFLIFAAALLLVLRNFRDILFIGFCVATGVLIIEQNFQIVGILTLGASAAVIAERLSGAGFRARSRRSAIAATGFPLLLMTLLVPVIVPNALALGMHAGLSFARTGQQVPLSKFEGIRLVRLWSEGAYPNFTRYNETMADGAAALAQLPRAAERVLVLDFAQPFSAGLDLRTAQGDSPWYHWGRTIDWDAFPPPEELFADVAIIMEPRSPIEFYTADGMRRVYAGHIDQHYQLAADTFFWRVYVARDWADEALSVHSFQSSTSRQSTNAQP